jgi:flavorubredoxin
MNKITDNIYYIGADDRELDLFEGQYETPEGISYNSHVIVDEKVAVLDTIDARKADEWKANLAEVLGDRKPDYLIVSHMEPDHSSLVKEMIDKYPQMQVVCSVLCVKMMARFFGEPVAPERIITVKDNSTLSLGEHTLQFFTAGMVHWPDVIVEYDQKEKILFSADAFGKFGALSFDDPEGWACEARRYYFNIVGKYGPQVQALLKKMAGLAIDTIAPLHGPVLRENLAYYLDLYNTWSSYGVETPGVFVAYASIHGGTAEVALKMAALLREKGCPKVAVCDLTREDRAEAVEDAFRYGTLVLAAASYDAGLFTPAYEFLHSLQMKGWQKRRVALIENGSWAPSAGRVMKEMFGAMKDVEQVGKLVTIRSRYKAEDQAALEALANAILA